MKVNAGRSVLVQRIGSAVWPRVVRDNLGTGSCAIHPQAKASPAYLDEPEMEKSWFISFTTQSMGRGAGCHRAETGDYQAVTSRHQSYENDRLDGLCFGTLISALKPICSFTIYP